MHVGIYALYCNRFLLTVTIEISSNPCARRTIPMHFDNYFVNIHETKHDIYCHIHTILLIKLGSFHHYSANLLHSNQSIQPALSALNTYRFRLYAIETYNSDACNSFWLHRARNFPISSRSIGTEPVKVTRRVDCHPLRITFWKQFSTFYREKQRWTIGNVFTDLSDDLHFSDDSLWSEKWKCSWTLDHQ